MNRYAKIGFICLSVSIFITVYINYYLFSPAANLNADVSQPNCRQVISGKIITPLPPPKINVNLTSDKTLIASITTSNQDYSITFDQLPGAEPFNLTFSPKYKDGVATSLSFDIENIKCNDNLNLDVDFTKPIEDQ